MASKLSENKSVSKPSHFNVKNATTKITNNKPVRGNGSKPNRVLIQRNSQDSATATHLTEPPHVSSTVTGGGHDDPIDARLAQLSDPSAELLTYYRRKVETLTEDHEQVQRRLDQIADAIGTQETLTWEVRQREAEIAELQRALSDMQVYLFQEREHVLRMYAENDRLKIRELDDRRKIQHLLQLSGLGPAEVTYFLRDSVAPVSSQNCNATADAHATEHDPGPEDEQMENTRSRTKCVSGLVVPPVIPATPAQGILELTASGKIIRRPAAVGSTTGCRDGTGDGADSSARQSTVSRSEHEAALREIEMTKATLRSLRTQLTEQTRTAREQIDTLLDDRRAMQEEMDALRKRNEDRVRQSAEQLKRCQDLLYDSTKEFLAQRNQFRQAEKVWIAEKDKLLSQLESKRVALAASGTNASRQTHVRSTQRSDTLDPGTLESKAWSQVVTQLSEKKQEQMAQTLANLEHQLEQQQKLSDMYREQVIQLEEELVRCREEGLMSKDVLKEHTAKLNQRLQTVNTRYRELERRRQLEMEGYRTDISTLRKKLREVEKQLLKLTLGFTDGMDASSCPKDVDLAILEQVKFSASRSAHLINELKNLKLKMYSLEDELRRV